MNVCLKSRPLTGKGVIESYRPGLYKIRLDMGGVVFRQRDDFLLR